MSRVGRNLVAHPWIVYAALALLAFPLFEMFVHGERALQYAHDVFDDDIPRLFALAADWRANGPVLWDPHLTAGNAWLAQFALPPFAPDVILSFVVPPFIAYAANTALMTFAAGLAMHLFLRDSLRLPAIACFAGGILATLAFWHYIYGYSALLLPLVLWTTDRALAATRRRRDVVGAILVLAFLFYSSQIQILVLDGLMALAWVLVSRDAARPLVARVATLAGIWVVGMLLAAPVLASQFAALPDSHRAIWDLAYLYPLGPNLRDFAHLYGGIVFGVPMTSGIGGTADIYGSFFLGAIGLPLLVVGIVAPRRDAREWLLLGLLVAIPVADLAALLVAPFQENLPLLRSFQFVRVRHLMPIVLIVNAAIGLAWLIGQDPVGRLSRPRRVVAALGLVAAGLAIAAQLAVAASHVLRPAGSDLIRHGWQLTLITLALGAVALVAIVLVATGRGSGHGTRGLALAGGLAVCLVLALTGERLLFARAERDLGGQLGTWAESVAPTTAQAFIASQPGGGRVLSIGEHANRALAVRLDAVDGYETIYPLRYHELFGLLIDPGLQLDPARYDYYHRWGNRAYAFRPELDLDIADLLGVRWLYVRGDPLPDTAGVTARFSGDGVTVYENAEAFPRTFIAHDLEVVPDRVALLAALATEDAPALRNRIYLAADDELPSTEGPVSLGPNEGDTAEIEADEIDRIVIRAQTTTPGYLVLADTYTPDWVAEVDGTPTTVLPIDGALRGVRLSPGDHRVAFSYRPVATYLGFGLAVLTAVLLGVWLWLGHRGRRRDATDVTPPDRAPVTPS
jgi:hypothetical protein